MSEIGNDYAGFATLREWRMIANKVDHTPETTMIEDYYRVQRFMLMSSPVDPDAVYITDLSGGHPIARVWFYKSVSDILSKKADILPDAGSDQCTEQVPGYTITIQILGCIQKIDSPIIDRLWWGAAREQCREMALWYALNVADPQKDGRFKRYKFI